MTDYVYYCRDGKNEELRYSIRSLYKNLPDVNVWVVGGKPDWYIGNYINIDIDQPKFENVRKQFKAIATCPDINENFVLMNDDFFILKPLDEIPVMHGGLLSDKVKSHFQKAGVGIYTDQLKSTYNSILNLGIREPLNYEIHVPMPMTKTGLLEALDNDGLVRSVYGNLNNVGGEYINDEDVIKRGWRARGFQGTFLSTLDNSFSQVRDVLVGQMLQERSPLEGG